MKNFVFVLIIGLCLATLNCAKVESIKLVSKTTENIAIKGYDTVSFFAENGAIKGNPQFEFVWNGAKWLFSSKENMEKFQQNPEQFAPQFGGHCSWSISHGQIAEGDPNAWKVVDSKLYLNNNSQVKEKWEAEQKKLIADGVKNWQEINAKQ